MPVRLPVDVRVFRDVTPAVDGMVHLQFVSGPERPFVNALELTRGIAGKLKPIRFTARTQDLVDTDGTRWGADNDYMNGRTMAYVNPDVGPRVSPLYGSERFGNFMYAIPFRRGATLLSCTSSNRSSAR